MSLYNMKADGDHWRVTKFSADLEVESSYLVSAEACDCPAGHRHTCRHRQMLPMFEQKGATRGQSFLDFDRKVWLPAICDDEQSPSSLEPTLVARSSDVTASEIENMLKNYNGPLPGDKLLEDLTNQSLNSLAAHGFTMLDLANGPDIITSKGEMIDLKTAVPKSSLRRI